MITFKQYLREEDETDSEHSSVQEAAEAFVKYCSQFPDAGKPLYRISGDRWEGPLNHKLKTRVPRIRNSESRGNTAEEQAFIFSQPAWKDYPARKQSIFCSTTTDFDVGEPDEEGTNLLAIYPFDGVKIAVLSNSDLNTMNIFKGIKGMGSVQLDDLFESSGYFFNRIFRESKYADVSDPVEQIKIIKKVFTKDGKFNSEANGDDELADRYAEVGRDNGELFELIALNIPEKLSPEAWGAKLVTSSGLDLPGEQRECWFSGKYLSIPYRYHDEFVAEVKKLK